MITHFDIEQAWARIAPYVRVTPVMQMERGGFNTHADSQIYLKFELMQHTGSFKARGAFNGMLSHAVPPSGVITASGGNHGAAVAYAAKALGYPAEIFVPKIASPVKIERLRRYGANVNVIGDNYLGAFAAMQARQRETGALVIHSYDQDSTLAGQGTCGRELDLQVPNLDTVLVACGGGGFIGGIATWYQQRAKVISIEPENAPSLARALAAGQPVNVPVSGIAADSLGATQVGGLMWQIAKDRISQAILVSDDLIRQTQRLLWDELRVVSEPGGATALAAIVGGLYRPQPGERVGVLLCGGNADLATIA